MNRRLISCSLALSVALVACADDDGPMMSDDAGMGLPDSGMEDGGSPPEDGGVADTDAGGGCDETTCVNGSCSGDVCLCEAGWTGATCEELNEPAEEGILLWFDADHDESFEIGAFDQVDSWTSRVAVNGPVVTTPEADDKRPRRLDDQLNGRPTVAFDGVDDTLSSDGDGFTYWDGADGVNTYTLFAVFLASVESQVAFSVVSNAHALGMAVGTGGRTGQVEARHGDATSDGGPLQLVSAPDIIELTDYHLVTLTVSETEVLLRVNGMEVQNVALDGGPIPLNIEQAIVNLGVDSIFFPDSRYLGGMLAEVIVFSGPLSPVVTEAVEAYLNAKWGL